VVVLIVVLGAALLIGTCPAALAPAREDARRIRCRNNLNELAKGMATYSEGRYYFPWPTGLAGCGTSQSPDFGGAEWLATLYWIRIIPDPGVYICPSTTDNNENGKRLGSYGCPGGTPLPADAVSYAGMHDGSMGIHMASKMGKGASYATSKLPIPEYFPHAVPMGSDDTEEPINHGTKDSGGMSVLFFDSHVEWWTHERVDLERGVGMGELVHLRN